MRASPVGHPPKVRPGRNVYDQHGDGEHVRRRTFLEELGSCRFVYGTVHCPINVDRESPINTVLEPQSLYQIHTSTSTYIEHS